MCQELLAGNPQEAFPGTFQEGGQSLSAFPCFSNVFSMQVMLLMLKAKLSFGSS